MAAIPAMPQPRDAAPGAPGDRRLQLGLSKIVTNDELRGDTNSLEALLALTDKSGAAPDATAVAAKVGQGHMTDAARTVRTEVGADGAIHVFKKGVFKMPNGDVYTGETYNELRHGAGTYAFANGDSYAGSFKAGLFDGYGVMTKAPFREVGRSCVGRQYSGFWEKGFRCGAGRFRNGFGDYYEGIFKADAYDGRGTMHFADGTRYVGEWARGRFHGSGSVVYSNGNSYEGDFVKGSFHGEGSFRFGAGSGSYKGGWKLGRKHGIGHRTFASGAEYEGEYDDDRISGKGIYKSAAGDLYVGTFRESRFHGEGTLIRCTGDRYQGQFQRGVPAGVGRWDFERGGFYEGEFMAQLRTGMPFRPRRKWVWDADGDGMKVARERAVAVEARRVHQAEQERLLAQQRRKAAAAARIGSLASDSNSLVPSSSMAEATPAAPPPPPRLRPPPRDKKIDDFAAPLLVGSPEDDEYCRLGGEVRGSGVMSAADGRRHGKGVRVYSDGARYEGEWYQDEQHGFGVYVGAGALGVRYEGSWREGRRHGTGVESYGHNDGLPYLCPLGNRHDGSQRCFYDGEWRSGYYWGEGCFTCCDGRQYSGSWRKGKRHGQGRWVMLPAALHYGEGGADEEHPATSATSFSDQGRVRVFEGTFDKGKRNGPGRATLNNDDVVEGDFELGRPDGLVRFTFTATNKVSYARYKLGVRVAWLKGPELQALLKRDEDAVAARVAALQKEQRRARLLLKFDVFGAGTRDKQMRVGAQLALEAEARPSSREGVH